MTAVFSGGAGSIDHGVGPVISGQAITTEPLTADTTFTLTVTSSAGSSVTATTTLTVVSPPTLTSFTNSGPITSGSAAILTAVFANGTGVVTPGNLAITSNVGLGTGNLAATTVYTLTVTNAAGTSITATTTVIESTATATLNLTLNGLPDGVAARVDILGPFGYIHTSSATESLAGLASGAYAVVPSGVWGTGAQAGQAYEATGGQTVILTAGGTSQVTVTYANAPSLTMQVRDASSPGSAVPLELVPIPAGTFQMGAYAGEQDSSSDEIPQYPVTLSQPFFLARFLTTQALWKAVAGTNPSVFSLAGGGSTTDDLTRPVEHVSWNDIMSVTTGFLSQLNAATAATRPAGTAFRLPTEAEWEYACRSGTTSRFYWGDDPAYANLTTYAWWSGNSGGTTHPVGTKGAGSANGFGLFDMNGDVWEWCEDWYGAYSTGSQTDPTGPANGSYRVVRGGSWYYGQPFCRSANRSNSGPDDRFSSIGFRVVLAPLVPH